MQKDLLTLSLMSAAEVSIYKTVMSSNVPIVSLLVSMTFKEASIGCLLLKKSTKAVVTSCSYPGTLALAIVALF